jgi:hypothetical protein
VAQSIIAHAIRANNPLFNDTWIKQAILTPSNVNQYSYFGFRVGIDGDTIVVGQPQYQANAFVITGTIYVFVKTGSDWTTMTETAMLTASDQAAETLMGTVAIQGNTIAASAVNLSGPGVFTEFVYVKPATGWADMTETAQLTATDNGLLPGETISNNTIAVQGNSSGYLYVKPTGGWVNMTQTAKLTTTSNLTFRNNGHNVAISGNTVVMPVQNVNGPHPLGAVAVYVEPKGGWTNMTQTAILTSTDSTATLNPVAISGSTVAAGDSGAVSSGRAVAGAVYVYVRPASGWKNITQTATLIASDATSNAALGTEVAIDGNTIAAFAPAALVNNRQAGASYVFTAPASGWTNMTNTGKLYFPDGYAGGLGWGLAVQGSTIVAGAPYTNSNGLQFTGEVLVFEQP